jgi:hypothetical protein
VLAELEARVYRGGMTEIVSKSDLNRRQAYPATNAEHIPPEMDHVELTYHDGRATVVVYEGSAEHFDFTDFVTDEPMDPKAALRSAVDAAERFAIDLVVIPDGLEAG